MDPSSLEYFLYHALPRRSLRKTHEWLVQRLLEILRYFVRRGVDNDRQTPRMSMDVNGRTTMYSTFQKTNDSLRFAHVTLYDLSVGSDEKEALKELRSIFARALKSLDKWEVQHGREQQPRKRGPKPKNPAVTEQVVCLLRDHAGLTAEETDDFFFKNQRPV
jgi:hypothetical protein